MTIIKSNSINDLFPMSIIKPVLKENLNNPHRVSGYKLPRGSGKSRAILSRLTGMDCFDLEPGHIPEIQTKEESKNIYEELEELFVKQNEHIKVLLISGAGKNDIKPLAILDYKYKTSEAVNGYDLMVALDCLIPNLSKEGLEHFIEVANNVLKMKDFDHGKPGTTKLKYNTLRGSRNLENMRETLGIVEERIEENSFHETIGKFKNIPPHFRPEYYHSGNIIEQKEKQNDN